MQREGGYIKVPIRSIKVVLDMEDPLSPEMILEEFIRAYGREPEPPRFRTVSIEVLTCPDDNQPMLASECGRHPRFIRRLENYAYFRGEFTA